MSDRDDQVLDAFLEDLGSARVPPDLAASVSRRVRDEHPARSGRFIPALVAAAAVVAVVALAGVAALVGGWTPSPSSESVAPPASSSIASASAPGVVSGVTPAPGTPKPSAVDTAPPTYPPGYLASLPSWRVNLLGAGAAHPAVALVVDPDGRLTRAAPAAMRFSTAGFSSGVLPGPTDHAVDVYWRGTTCDGWAQVDLSTDGRTITVSTTPRVTPCTPGGFEYGLELVFASRVDAAAFSLTMGTPQRYTGDSSGPAAVAFSDASHGLAALSMGLAVAAETADGGGTWRLTPVADGWPTGLGSNDTTAWMSVMCDPSTWDHCAPGVYRRDSGVWTRAHAMQPGSLAIDGQAIAAVDQPLEDHATGTALPATGIQLSEDGGATWTSIASPCAGPMPTMTGISFDPARQLVVVCEGEGAGGTAQKVMLGTNDPPGAWVARVQLPARGTGMGLALAAGGFGLLWGNRSPLLITSDGGGTWTTTSVADGDVRIVRAADAWSNGGGVIVVWDPDRPATLLLTSADGRTWKEMTSFADVPCCGG